MKHTYRRVGYRIAPTVCCAFAVFATAWLPQQASAADETPRRAMVYCKTDKDSMYPFPAGSNYCFKKISGKTSVYKSAVACVYDSAEEIRMLGFVFSVLPKATCMPEHRPVTQKENYRWGFDLLSAEEKAFFLNHVETR